MSVTACLEFTTIPVARKSETLTLPVPRANDTFHSAHTQYFEAITTNQDFPELLP